MCVDTGALTSNFIIEKDQFAILPATYLEEISVMPWLMGITENGGPLESALSLSIMALESGVKTLKKMLSPRSRTGQPCQHWD